LISEQVIQREILVALLSSPRIRLVCNSEVGSRSFEHWLGLQRGSAPTVRNGYDFSEMLAKANADESARIRERIGAGPTTLVIGAVARLVNVKRIELWVASVAEIIRRNPDARGLCVGDGPLLATLKAQAAELAVADQIHFAGAQKPIEPWMGAMDAILLTSRMEGLPNVLIEAQALGNPGGLDPGSAGRQRPWSKGNQACCLTARIPVLIADGMLAMLAPERKRSFSEAARTHVIGTFSREKMLNDLATLYETGWEQ
jgi:glycosyltransferase involved in cell wall biosynthesis